jgi:hypothetical protein
MFANAMWAPVYTPALKSDIYSNMKFRNVTIAFKATVINSMIIIVQFTRKVVLANSLLFPYFAIHRRPEATQQTDIVCKCNVGPCVHPCFKK